MSFDMQVFCEKVEIYAGLRLVVTLFILGLSICSKIYSISIIVKWIYIHFLQLSLIIINLVNLSKFEENVKELQRLKALQNFQETLIVADKALVPNVEPFDCPICFDNIGTKEGVVLRECLHKICRFVQIQFFANLK